jgi:D-amino-acid dehydrogenase
VSADVAVVGGGVVGLCVAEALERRGAGVVVLDAERCGAAASAGNAGWVTPGICDPLPAPGTMAQALRWMARPGSPLLVRPTLNPAFLRWSYAFWRSTSPRRYRAGMAALVALGDRALAAFDSLAEAGVDFEMHADGLLFVALSKEVRDDELRLLRQQRAVGYRGRFEVLDAAALRAREPALGATVAAGILAADERHVRPETLTAGLAAHLRERGADVREGARVAALAAERTGWRVLLEGGAELRADRVVVAAGAASARLLAPLGLEVPLEGAKGYSITEPAPSVRPRTPLYLLEAKLGVSPFDGGVRLAGTLELGARSLALSPARLRALDDAAGRYLRGWRPSPVRHRWAGLRPLLPDGLPAIGPVPGRAGLFVATGHAMLGVTLAPATAELLAPAVLEDQGLLELAPFSLARFARRALDGNGLSRPRARASAAGAR